MEVRHKWNGRGQIQPDITAIAPVLQERAQRGGQQLGCLQMQPWRPALHKPHHIPSTQLRKPDRSVAKAILQELANKRHIVDDGRLRQGPFLAQVPLKCLGALFNRAQSLPACLLDGDYVLITQKIEELPQCRSVTLANPLPSRATSQVPSRVPS
jgi:hypothetical protein